MTIGYIRVSTKTQDYNNQKHGILEYANLNNLGKIVFKEETISSRKSYKDRDLFNVINSLKKGDILVVSELSRIGRSLLEVMSIFKDLVEKGVTTHIIKGNFIIGNDNKITSSVLIFAFGLSAEIERELISSRTKEALANKKANGAVLGRKKGSISKSKLDGKEDEIRELISKGVNPTSISKIYSVARSTMNNFIKSRGLGA